MMKPLWSDGLASMPERILWQEGDLLTQQHFQEERRRHESLVSLRMASAQPFSWGILSLEIDRLVLADGLFRVSKLEAVMPDGLVIRYPSLEDPPLEIELFSGKLDIKAAPVCVHLTIARQPIPGESSEARFRLAAAPAITDEMTGEDPIELERMIPSLALQITQSPQRPPSSRFASLPLACVTWQSESPALTNYVPPSLAMDDTNPLAGCACKLAATMRRRASDMSQRFETSNSGHGESTGVDWTFVRAIGAALPRLEALLATNSIHPFDLYLALCDAAGALLCHHRQPLPTRLQAYDHKDPGAAFEQVISLIERALSRSGVPYQLQRFDTVSPGHFLLSADCMDDVDEVILGLRVARGVSAVEVSEWLFQAVIASGASVKPTRAARSTGAKRRRVDASEQLWFTPPTDLLIFALQIDARFIRIDEPLEISGTASLIDAAPLELALIQRPTSIEPTGTDKKTIAVVSDPALEAFQPA